MILEPYGIEVVDLEKVYYSWFNNVCRIGENWIRFFPTDAKKNFKTGEFFVSRGGDFARVDNVGDFVRVGKVIFFREYKESFYA